MSNPTDLEDLEIRLLLEGVHARWGYDFRDYATASLRRRVHDLVQAEGVRTVAGLIEGAIHDPACAERLVLALTIHVTAMFRDPPFYRCVRERLVPMLKTYPYLRIWVAGCSSGEEAYSLAILLREEGLAERSRIFATDLCDAVLRQARSGVIPLRMMKEYTENYLAAGGRSAFSDYYTAAADHAILRADLRESVVFAQHSLVTDASFNEFHLIFCRNVMIYFNERLQERVHRLLHGSLCPLGYLALGNRESLRFTACEDAYESVDAEQRLFRRVK